MSSQGEAGLMMLAAVELERERATLERAEQDLVEGADRLRRQRELVLSLRLLGADTELAERLEHSFDATLTEWVRHRDAIEQRIAHLQRRVAAGD